MKKDTISKLSLGLGIASLAFSAIECVMPIIIIGIILGIIACVLGILSLKSENKNLSIIGIVLGIGGIILASVWIYLIIISK